MQLLQSLPKYWWNFSFLRNVIEIFNGTALRFVATTDKFKTVIAVTGSSHMQSAKINRLYFSIYVYSTLTFINII